MANQITIKRGNTYPMTYRHTDATGAAVSLVSCTVFFTVKSNEYDSDQTDASAKIAKSITSHTDPEGGVSEWLLTHQDTYLDPQQEYYFDVTVKDANGRIVTPIEGTLIIDGHPTNREAA